jgi:hypothetical protein
MADIHLHRIRAATPADLREYLRTHEVDAGCSRVQQHEDGSVSIDVFAADDAREELAGDNCTVEVVENATQTGQQRQQEVGRGDRFSEARALPQGVGIKR